MTPGDAVALVGGFVPRLVVSVAALTVGSAMGLEIDALRMRYVVATGASALRDRTVCYPELEKWESQAIRLEKSEVIE